MRIVQQQYHQQQFNELLAKGEHKIAAQHLIDHAHHGGNTADLLQKPEGTSDLARGQALTEVAKHLEEMAKKVPPAQGLDRMRILITTPDQQAREKAKVVQERREMFNIDTVSKAALSHLNRAGDAAAKQAAVSAVAAE